MTLSLARVSIVLGVVFSSFIATRYAWMVGQVMLIVLVALYRINELVQKIPPAGSHGQTQAWAIAAFASGIGLCLSEKRITAFYVVTIGFALVEFAMYVIIVGHGTHNEQDSFRRRQSVSSRHHSFAKRRSSVWRERPVDQEQEQAPRAGSTTADAHQGIAGLRDDDLSEGSSDDSDIQDDEDAIVDIPRPSLRSRRSAASFYYAVDGRVRSPVKTRQDSAFDSARLSTRSGYGAIQ
ncbi:hypothetical protein ACM66B_001396 [Microbotryomycetes sp. NB124-2]